MKCYKFTKNNHNKNYIVMRPITVYFKNAHKQFSIFTHFSFLFFSIKLSHLIKICTYYIQGVYGHNYTRYIKKARYFLHCILFFAQILSNTI